MKQIYLKFSMLLLLVVVGLGSVKGQETQTVTQSINGTATWDGTKWVLETGKGDVAIFNGNVVENGKTSTITVSCIAIDESIVSDISFKITEAKASMTKKGSDNATGTTIKNNTISATASQGGCTFNLTSGTISYSYVLKMNFTTQSLSLAANNKDGYWATFSNNDVTFIPTSDVEGVYTVTVSGTTMTKNLLTTATVKKADGTEITGYFVPAKTGVLINSQNTSATYYTVENKTMVDLDNNYLKPASETMTGEYTFYKLSYRSANLDGLGFYYGAANGAAFEMTKTNTAYLAVPKGGDVKAFVIEDSATPIKSVTAVAEENAPIFNLAGQRIANPIRGQMYIKNGKKYLAK